MPSPRVFDLPLPELPLEAGARLQSHVTRGWWWGPEQDLPWLHARAHLLTEERVRESALRVVRRTREWPALALGASPRASASLLLVAKAYAARDGRAFLLPDDVKAAAVPVLRHRVSANFQAQAEGKTSDDIVTELLKVVGSPEPAKYMARKKA